VNKATGVVVLTDDALRELTVLCNEVIVLCNDVTVFCNDVTVLYSEVNWPPVVDT